MNKVIVLLISGFSFAFTASGQDTTHRHHAGIMGTHKSTTRADNTGSNSGRMNYNARRRRDSLNLQKNNGMGREADSIHKTFPQ